MRYVQPFYREVEDEERFGGILIPFLGGALLGGLFAYNAPHNNYIPYNNYPPVNYYNNSQYPMYSQYPTYNQYQAYQTYKVPYQYPYYPK